MRVPQLLRCLQKVGAGSFYQAGGFSASKPNSWHSHIGTSACNPSPEGYRPGRFLVSRASPAYL
jgi:hypothetical protein